MARLYEEDIISIDYSFLNHTLPIFWLNLEVCHRWAFETFIDRFKIVVLYEQESTKTDPLCHLPYLPY